MGFVVLPMNFKIHVASENLRGASGKALQNNLWHLFLGLV
jgi:hypothetical protein